MKFVRLISVIATVALTGCLETPNNGSHAGGAHYVVPGGAQGGPPPGRTEAERQARKDYYRGPRGDEF